MIAREELIKQTIFNMCSLVSLILANLYSFGVNKDLRRKSWEHRALRRNIRSRGYVFLLHVDGICVCQVLAEIWCWILIHWLILPYLCFSSGQKRSLSSQRYQENCQRCVSWSVLLSLLSFTPPRIRWPLVVQVNNWSRYFHIHDPSNHRHPSWRSARHRLGPWTG